MKILGLTLSLFFFLAAAAGAQSFDKDTPYEDAVPAFIDAITDATASVKDQGELESIAQWETDARSRLPEFLNDLVLIAQQLESQGSYEFIIDEYTAFAMKWNQIAAEYPGLNELDALISPLIDQLLAGLPTLQAPPSDNPMSGLAGLYRALEIEDPWGLGGLFIIEPLPNTDKRVRITETRLDTKTKGVKSKFIISRETIATLNGVTVYFELVDNGQTVQRFVNFRDPSLIHETLNLMIANNEDPAVIAALTDLVSLLDLYLEQALNDGILDECSYSFVYRKINANMAQACIDQFGSQQDTAFNSRFDPFDDLNQVELSDPEELLFNQSSAQMQDNSSALLPLQTPPTQQLLNNYNQGFVGTAQTFVIGVVFPAYLFSLFGLFKGL